MIQKFKNFFLNFSQKSKFQRYVFVLAIVFSLTLLLMPKQVSAWGLCDISYYIPSIVTAWCGLSDLFNADSVGQAIVGVIDAIVHGILGGIIFLFGRFITLMVEFQNGILKLDVVKEGWKIFRDFANMFFILLLLITAFGTIFNVKNFTAKDMLVKIIIAALMINFSFVIFQATVDLLWFPSTIFKNAMTSDISGSLMQAIGMATLTKGAPADLAAQLTFTIMKGILFLLVAFSLGWIAIVLLVRIPALIGLAVLSPIAWLSFAFPRFRSFWSKWWHQTIQWSLIPTLYFAVIYFVFFFSGKVGDYIRKSSTIEQPDILPLSVNVMLLMFVTIGLLIGGLMMANKIAKGAGVYGYSAAAGLVGLTGITGGAKKAWSRIRQEGVRIPGTQKRVGGPQAQEMREAKWERRLGRMAGAPSIKDQQTLVEQADQHVQLLNQELATKAFKNVGERQDYIKSELGRAGVNKERKLALLLKASDEGIMSDSNFENAVKEYGNQGFVMNDLFKRMKDKDFASVSPEVIKRAFAKGGTMETNLEAKRMFYSWITSDSKAAKFAVPKVFSDPSEYRAAFEILGKETTAEGRNLEREVSKMLPYLVAKAKGGKNEALVFNELKTMLGKMDTTDLTKISQSEWSRPEFLNAMAVNLGTMQRDDPQLATQYFKNLRGSILRNNRAVSKELGELLHMTKEIPGFIPPQEPGSSARRVPKSTPEIPKADPLDISDMD